MKLRTVKAFILTMTIGPVVTGSTAVLAQIDQSRLLPTSIDSTISHRQESRIVISVREFSAKDNLCESRFGYAYSASAAGSTYAGDWGGFDFPHAGRSRAIDDFPHPSKPTHTFSRSLSRSFQLPAGSANPDIVGCVDTQRNVVFIHIKPQQKLPTQLSPSIPIPPPRTEPQSPSIPVPPPQQPTPSTPISPRNPAQIDSQTEILRPQPNQPVIR